jgi:antitoxin (DNA-binding transcriptional repressor) of toxin-antitoxin stability system
MRTQAELVWSPLDREDLLESYLTSNGDIIVSMATIHISEADAARDFSGLMAHVRAGAEIVIENGTLPVAVIHAPVPPRRSISESIVLAETRSKELGYKPVMDAGFAADMEAIIRNRKPRDTSAWD